MRSSMIQRIIHDILHVTLKIYTDGSMSDCGISGSGMHIETPDGTFDIKIKNIKYFSAFRSELIAIYKGLRFIDTASDLVIRDIWILTGSRASIQHLYGSLDSVPILQCTSTYDKQLHFLGAYSSEISEVRFPSLRGRRSEDILQTGEITTKGENPVPARLKQLKEGQASPDDPVLVHHEELKQRKDQSSPDNCRPDSHASVHHEGLQQRKDKSGPVNCRPEIPDPIYHEEL
ncbi:uncharacterized protein TNCV_4009211 [Trichonephila clavipes]|nr:uncharacterized protein TNCV_4009211 [Trichonephila clavipes]